MNHYWLRFLIYANYNITDSEVLTLSDFYIVNTIHSFFLCNFEKRTGRGFCYRIIEEKLCFLILSQIDFEYYSKFIHSKLL